MSNLGGGKFPTAYVEVNSERLLNLEHPTLEGGMALIDPSSTQIHHIIVYLRCTD